MGVRRIYLLKKKFKKSMQKKLFKKQTSSVLATGNRDVIEGKAEAVSNIVFFLLCCSPRPKADSNRNRSKL